MLSPQTRPWREERPVYVERQAPCQSGCPAGENIRQWLSLAQSGEYEAAWRALTEVNPLPATMGRVCYHPCESACNRAQLEGAVNINAVERFLGDEAIRQGWRFDPLMRETGKRILVVGSGPSGLTAAYHLRRMGHTVVLRDSAAAAGGMMRYGIPTYRLPRSILDAEIARIVELGVTLELGAKVEDIRTAMAGFDAAYLAVGAHIAKHTSVAGSDAATILDAVSLLRTMENGEMPRLGRRVTVYGGGNTALDVARTARRLGCEVTIVYRRNRALMPAHNMELQEALEEGVEIRWLSTVKSVASDGTITLERMALDTDGFPQPTGEQGSLASDALVMALGQDADLGLVHDLIETRHGLVCVDTAMMTGQPGLFAGGDMVRPVRTATIGIGDGRNAARHIDSWLRGATTTPEDASEPASFDKLHPWYYQREPRTDRTKREPAARLSDFAEVLAGLDETSARREAHRCMSCGECFACGSCRDVCPEDAIIGAARGFEIVIEKCTTCKLCIRECPCGAIAVAPR